MSFNTGQIIMENDIRELLRNIQKWEKAQYRLLEAKPNPDIAAKNADNAFDMVVTGLKNPDLYKSINELIRLARQQIMEENSTIKSILINKKELIQEERSVLRDLNAEQEDIEEAIEVLGKIEEFWTDGLDRFPANADQLIELFGLIHEDSKMKIRISRSMRPIVRKDKYKDNLRETINKTKSGYRFIVANSIKPHTKSYCLGCGKLYPSINLRL
jgi:hypothetical protein